LPPSRRNTDWKYADIKSKVVAATELRDQVDMWCSGQSYVPFLQKFVPVLLKLLDGPPVFISTSLEQVGPVIADRMAFY
jgi:hypothetical protein